MTDPQPKVDALAALLQLASPVPKEWVEEEKKAAATQNRIRPAACKDWREVRGAWYKAVRMRQGLEDILVTSLAVSLSTQQQGEQVYLQVVGPPGAGKTRLVSSLLVSDHCYPFEHVKGIFSGWRSGFGDDDYSMINRLNGRTLITPEGDVVVNNKDFPELMSHLRRMFDGSITADYKTLKEQRRYDGLRCPVIIAGTPIMMRAMSQPQLGDRFIRIFVDDPGANEEREILRRIAHRARRSVRTTSNCSAETQMSPEMTLAYRLTGGYVDHLRESAGRLLGCVDHGKGEWVEQACEDLAQFTSFLRTRFETDPRKRVDEEPRRELPGRLLEQYIRLADCVAALEGKPEVDRQVIRLIRKIAVDTADSRMVSIVANVQAAGEAGAYTASLARWAGTTDEKMHDTLTFLEQLGTLSQRRGSGGPGSDAYSRWYLSDEMTYLWEKVHSA